MARSPFTLAASVTSALPRAGVVSVGALTEGSTGHYDAAVATLDDGRHVVVRVPNTPEAASELAAESRALRTLSAGVRGLLPFQAPTVLGESSLDGERVVVVDFLPGYRIDAAHVPPGPGAATSIGEALAALHALPMSIVRTEGLPARTPQQVREDVRRLVDRVAAVDQSPLPLLERWRHAIATDELWQFESTVVLGGIGAASFLFADVNDTPTVTGALEWRGLCIGDPATDLQWLASAPVAADDVFAAYTARSDRAPDALVRERARLYAELEFAKWMVHGDETERADIVDDAARLLTALADSTLGDDIVPASALGVDGAIALLDRLPGGTTNPGVDTSMQTDTYDPEELSPWGSDDTDTSDVEPIEPAAEPGTDDAPPAQEPASDAAAHDEKPRALFTPSEQLETTPLDFDALRRREAAPARASQPVRPQDAPAPTLFDDPATTEGHHEAAAQADANRASDAALRRWLAP